MPHQPLADTTAAQKSAIVMQKSLGMTNHQIADKENVSPSTVSCITNRYAETNDFEAKGTKTGWKPKMTNCDIHLACRMLSTSHACNAMDLQRQFFPNLHPDTI
jgi:orotate phosphoribosyltransferase-like protein